MDKENLILRNHKVLIAEEQLQTRIKELAEQINKDYEGKELVLVSVLKGSFMFLADLIKHLTIPVQIEFIRLSSYGNDTRSCGKVKAVDLTLPNLGDKDILIVEDIIDTGLTASFLINYFSFQHPVASIKFSALLNKECARTQPVTVDYSGFIIDDKFVIGYGLDYAGYYRNLPYIGYFS